MGKPFSYKGVLYSSDNIDFDDIEGLGMYACIKKSGDFLNSPNESKDGCLSVFRHDDTNTDVKYIVQEYNDYESNTYIRIRWGTSWKDWMKIEKMKL